MSLYSGLGTASKIITSSNAFWAEVAQANKPSVNAQINLLRGSVYLTYKRIQRYNSRDDFYRHDGGFPKKTVSGFQYQHAPTETIRLLPHLLP